MKNTEHCLTSNVDDDLINFGQLCVIIIEHLCCYMQYDVRNTYTRRDKHVVLNSFIFVASINGKLSK